MHSPWGSHYTKWRAHGISSWGAYCHLWLLLFLWSPLSLSCPWGLWPGLSTSLSPVLADSSWLLVAQLMSEARGCYLSEVLFPRVEQGTMHEILGKNAPPCVPACFRLRLRTIEVQPMMAGQARRPWTVVSCCMSTYHDSMKTFKTFKTVIYLYSMRVPVEMISDSSFCALKVDNKIFPVKITTIRKYMWSWRMFLLSIYHRVNNFFFHFFFFFNF